MYKIWGKVIKHKQRGKELGFPTANINLHKKIPEGVYISKTKLNGKVHPSVTFIGKAETFNEKRLFAETYILDFNQDIYNKWISIALVKKIRDSKKFKLAQDLIKQMKKDEEIARIYFALS